jgi:hypothetical protein
MIAAIMGAKSKSGHPVDHHAEKESAERIKRSTITTEGFDHQVADKMGACFEDTFLPAMKKLVEAGLSYAEVKRRVTIPAAWGAKIRGDRFQEGVARQGGIMPCICRRPTRKR